MSGLPPSPPPDPEHLEGEATSAPGPAPQPSADHHGLIVFLGVLALVLLLVGAVGAAGLSGGSGSSGAGPVATPGSGNAYGQQKEAQKAERRAQREAEKRQRKQDQLERKARREELKEQRRQSGAMGLKVAEGLSEQTGTVATQTAADGTTVYVLQTATGTLVLDVGPPRYWGESHPLAPFVGQSVTVSGVQEPGSGEFAVYAIGDQVIRGPGRPPWAGGWKVDVMEVPTPDASPSPTPSTAP